MDSLNLIGREMLPFKLNGSQNSSYEPDKGTGSKKGYWLVWKGETEGCGRELSECISYMNKITKNLILKMVQERTLFLKTCLETWFQSTDGNSD